MRMHSDTFIKGVRFIVRPRLDKPVRVALYLYSEGVEVEKAEGVIRESTMIDFDKPYFVPRGAQIHIRLEFRQDYTCGLAHEISALLIAATI